MDDLDEIQIDRILIMIWQYFDYDTHKCNLWLKTKNPAIGGITPEEMIKNGRADKLLLFIKNAIDGNSP